MTNYEKLIAAGEYDPDISLEDMSEDVCPENKDSGFTECTKYDSCQDCAGDWLKAEAKEKAAQE